MNIPNSFACLNHILLKKESLLRIRQRRLWPYLHPFRIQCGIFSIEKLFGVEVFGVVGEP